MEPETPGAAFFCLEPELTQFGRSRLRDFGRPHHCRKARMFERFTQKLEHPELL